MKVAIVKNDGADYCREAPFHPSEAYPEYPFREICETNTCYAEIRNLLYKMGLDKEHYGQKSWNPMGEFIRPGDRVFLKPNFVSHKNKVGGIEATVTHGSVIRAILDYVYIALQGKGKITIGDAPYINTDFGKVLEATGVDSVLKFYESCSCMKVPAIDLRKHSGPLQLGRAIKKDREGDPLGYSVIDLAEDSEHYVHRDHAGSYRVAFYEREEMLKHHTERKNEYLIANSILDATVIINLPKLKTHSKTGISCALKNLIGINGVKDWLPHHSAGPAEKGGDEYLYSDFRKDLFTRIKDEIPSSGSLLRIIPLRAAGAGLFISKKVLPFKDDYDAGGWYGNETLPRTIADLNKILVYASSKGIMQDTCQRKMFILVDGLVAGEKEGPMSASPKKCGVLAAGFNPVAVDIVCSRICGFDDRKMSTNRCAASLKKYPLLSGDTRDIKIMADRCTDLDGVYAAYNCALEPPKSWKGHIEYEGEKAIVSPAPAPVATAPGR